MAKRKKSRKSKSPKAESPKPESPKPESPKTPPGHPFGQFIEGPYFLTGVAVIITILAFVFWKPSLLLAGAFFALAVWRADFFPPGWKLVGNVLADLFITAVLIALLYPSPSPLATKSEATALLRFEANSIPQQYARIAEGEKFAVNTYAGNPGPGRVFNAVGFSNMTLEDADATVNDKVLGEFEHDVETSGQAYRAGKWKGQDQAPGQGILTTVFLAPFTAEQAKGALEGTKRIYVTSWVAWTDEAGQKQSASICRWLQPSANVSSMEGDAIWHFCRGGMPDFSGVQGTHP
jgi:hypothetical protein